MIANLEAGDAGSLQSAFSKQYVKRKRDREPEIRVINEQLQKVDEAVPFKELIACAVSAEGRGKDGEEWEGGGGKGRKRTK